MKRLWTLTAATIALLLLLSTPTLATATLTNTAMLNLRDGLMAQDEFAPGTYPHYNTLPEDQDSPFAIQYEESISLWRRPRGIRLPTAQESPSPLIPQGVVK